MWPLNWHVSIDTDGFIINFSLLSLYSLIYWLLWSVSRERFLATLRPHVPRSFDLVFTIMWAAIDSSNGLTPFSHIKWMLRTCFYSCLNCSAPTLGRDHLQQSAIVSRSKLWYWMPGNWLTSACSHHMVDQWAGVQGTIENGKPPIFTSLPMNLYSTSSINIYRSLRRNCFSVIFFCFFFSWEIVEWKCFLAQCRTLWLSVRLIKSFFIFDSGHSDFFMRKEWKKRKKKNKTRCHWIGLSLRRAMEIYIYYVI